MIAVAMARFQFTLQSLLEYREHQRELCRAVLGQAIKSRQDLVEEKESVLREREETIGAIRQQTQSGKVSISAISSLRYHVNRLLGVAAQLDRKIADASIRVEQCRTLLVNADQSVKAVEKLREHRFKEFEKLREAMEDREREEIWQSGRLRGAG